jgi:lambda family phage tail tape measure protein
MAMNLQAMLRIKADVQGENNIRRLGNSMQGVEGRVKNLNLAMAGLRGGIGGLIGLVGGGVIFTKIFGDTATLQSQAKSLQVLTGSAQQASQIIRELQSYGAATPFEATELIETAKRLNAFGVESVRVVEVVKNLGDVAGATGANLTELATAYGQVVAKGRLQGEELLQFQERGVALSAELQQMYKLQGQEFTKALEGGRISAEAVELAIERLTDAGGKYADGAIAQSDTLNGKFSTLKDNITALSQTLGNILAPAMKAILDYAINILDTINLAIKTAINGPQEADTRAAIKAGKLPFGGPEALDRIIGEARRRQLQQQAGPGFLGFGFDTQNFIRLLQQQPEFSKTDRLTRPTQRAIPALLPGRASDPEAAAKKAEAAAKRAAAEQERLEERRRDLGQRALDLQRQLRESVEDLNSAYAGVGANEFDQLALRRNEAITENNRLVDELTRDVVKLALEINEAGGQIDIKPFEDLINQISEGNVALADKEYQQGLKEIGDRAAEAAIDLLEFTDAAEAQQGAIKGARDGIAVYLEGIGSLAENISNAAQNALKGLEDAIVSLTMTGKFSFKEFALSVIEDLTRMVTRMLIIAPILQFIQSLLPGGPLASANANLSGAGALSSSKLFPLGAFASGGTFTNGIVNSPTLFKFASGGALRNGLMGEAGPEAIIPLKRGRDGKLGVAGGGGTSVVVNVDAKGTNVQGNSGQGEQLGRAISQAVQAELVRQKRPGGLLAA